MRFYNLLGTRSRPSMAGAEETGHEWPSRRGRRAGRLRPARATPAFQGRNCPHYFIEPHKAAANPGPDTRCPAMRYARPRISRLAPSSRLATPGTLFGGTSQRSLTAIELPGGIAQDGFRFPCALRPDLTRLVGFAVAVAMRRDMPIAMAVAGDSGYGRGRRYRELEHVTGDGRGVHRLERIFEAIQNRVNL